MSVKCHYALLSFSSSSLYYHLHVGPMCQVTFNLQPFTLPLTHAIAAHLPPQSPRWLSLLPASPSAALAPPPSPVFLGSVFGIFRFGFRFFVPSLTLATVMKQGGEASGIGWRREVEGGGWAAPRDAVGSSSPSPEPADHRTVRPPLQSRRRKKKGTHARKKKGRGMQSHFTHRGALHPTWRALLACQVGKSGKIVSLSQHRGQRYICHL
jgi:hypothetical protein